MAKALILDSRNSKSNFLANFAGSPSKADGALLTFLVRQDRLLQSRY